MIEWNDSAAAQADPATLVFLLGAGASYGAGGVLPYPPPLGCQLYDRLALEFPKTWGAESQLAGIADQFRIDFEQAMGQYCNFHSASAAIPQIIDMARYFAPFEPDGSDLYSKLIRELDNRALLPWTVFALLNYECVFEKAAVRLGYRLHYEGIDRAQVMPGDIRVIKPHGSCNFLTRRTTFPISTYLSTGAAVEAGVEAHSPESIVSVLEELAAESMPERTRYVVMSNYESSKNTPLVPRK